MATSDVNIDVKRELIGVLDPNVPFDVNWRTLCSFKDRGVTAEEAQGTLESMFQATNDERIQERIAELLDCVVGWCSPQFLVWRK